MDSVPEDPFDGQPLRFRPLRTGFVVYSIGSDRKDNDGKEHGSKSQTKDSDETFIIER
jgi:hypothetical protein